MEQHSAGGLRGALESVADRLRVRQPQPQPWPCSHSPCTGRCTAMPLLRNESQRWLAEAAASQLEEMIGLAASAAAEADAERASEGEGEGEGEVRDFVLGMCIEREQLLTERISHSPLPFRSPTLALQSSSRSRPATTVATAAPAQSPFERILPPFALGRSSSCSTTPATPTAPTASHAPRCHSSPPTHGSDAPPRQHVT
jgi:hypothetical protein